jgi:site-specific recombinase XerD
MVQATLADLADAYIAERYRRGDFGKSTVPAVRWHLRAFCRYAGAVDPGDISAALVDAWLGSEPLAKSTVRHRLSWFRGWCRWLIRHGWMRDDPTRDLRAPRMPRPTARTLRPADIGRLLRHTADARMRLIVLLMAQEGLRACEVARAETGDVDWEDHTIAVRGKGGEGRLLPVSDETWEALGAYVGHRVTTGPLIRSKYGGGAITAQYVSLIVSGQMRAAGVHGTGHALRHSMAAHVLRSGRGADIRDVQMALGHASLATTAIYLPHSDVDRLRHVMAGRWYEDVA